MSVCVSKECNIFIYTYICVCACAYVFISLGRCVRLHVSVFSSFSFIPQCILREVWVHFPWAARHCCEAILRVCADRFVAICIVLKGNRHISSKQHAKVARPCSQRLLLGLVAANTVRRGNRQ